MLARVDLRGFPTTCAARSRDRRSTAADVGAAVAAIIAEVRARGDAAVRELHRALRRCRDRRARGRRGRDRGRARPRSIPALRGRARARRATRSSLARGAGGRGRRARAPRRARSASCVVPVDRAGCYVPGGRAPLASSVLMTAIPARVAGVAEVALCTPPGPDGTRARRDPRRGRARRGRRRVPRRRRAGDRRAGVRHRVDRRGRRDRRSRQRATSPRPSARSPADVGIDGYAGPSEVAVVADETVDAGARRRRPARAGRARPGRRGRADHVGRGGRRRGRARARRRCSTARRARDETEATLRAGGRLVLVDGPEQAIDAANADRARAPRADVRRRRARSCRSCATPGAVFVRRRRAGGDRRLRRGRQPRAARPAAPRASPSALRVDDFRKHVHVVSLDAGRARAQLAPFVTTLAEAEGLDAHADAIRRREPS